MPLFLILWHLADEFPTVTCIYARVPAHLFSTLRLLLHRFLPFINI